LLLSAIGDRLDPQYPHYPEWCDSILKGINAYVREMPTQRGTIRRLMYGNLDVSPHGAMETDKPYPPRFRTFTDYRQYLSENYALIVANARDVARTQPMAVCSTQSRGYDTTAMNAIAAPHGLDKVFTMDSPDDDGAAICQRLGVPCIQLNRTAFAAEFQDEYLYYCALHHTQDVNLKDMRQHMPGVTLLLTGINGDVIWSRASKAALTGLDTVIRRADSGGHGMNELRLEVGFVQLPFPFMGARRKPDIVSITESTEMEPWRVGTDYDRPIPRRIAEVAGIPREWFGQTKMASVIFFPPPAMPHGPVLRREFLAYLSEERLLSRFTAWFYPLVRWYDGMLLQKSTERYVVIHFAERVVRKLFGLRFKPLWTRLDGALFCYCVNRTAGDLVHLQAAGCFGRQERSQ